MCKRVQFGGPPFDIDGQEYRPSGKRGWLEAESFSQAVVLPTEYFRNQDGWRPSRTYLTSATVGSGRLAFHPEGVVWVVTDKSRYLRQPLWIGDHLPPAFMADEAIPGTPQGANLVPLLLVGLLRRFKSATHPVQRISTLWALRIRALSELPRLAARKASMGPMAWGRHRTSM